MKGAIFVYLLTYGGAAAALFNPYVGLLIYIFLAILRPESLWGFSIGVGNNYSRVVAVAVIIGWMIRGFGDWRLGRSRAVMLALLGFLGWASLSALNAPDQRQAWGWVTELGKVVLPFVIGLSLIQSVRQLKQLAWVIVLGHGYVAYELNAEYYFSGLNRVQEFGFGFMDNNCVSITMVACTGLAFFLGLNAERWWQKALALGSAALMGHIPLLSFSRGGMLGLILTGGISFLILPKKPVYYLVFIGAVLLGLRLAGPQVTERFMTVFASKDEQDDSAATRADLWMACVHAAARDPILGLGPHHFPLHAHEFGLTPGKEGHTLWLQLMAEIGVPGLLFLVAFYGICVARLFPYTLERVPVNDPFIRDIARMVIASVAGFALAAQFVSLPGLEAPYYITLLGAGALKLASMPVTERSESDNAAVDHPNAYPTPRPVWSGLGGAAWTNQKAGGI